MLFNRSRWRFASERNPEREARCLCVKFGDMEDDQVKGMIVDAISEAAQANTRRQKIDEDIRAIVDEFREEILSLIQEGNATEEDAGGPRSNPPDERARHLAEKVHSFTQVKSPALASTIHNVLFETQPDGSITVNPSLLRTLIGTQQKIDTALDHKTSAVLQSVTDFCKDPTFHSPVDALEAFYSQQGDRVKQMMNTNAAAFFEAATNGMRERLTSECEVFSKNDHYRRRSEVIAPFAASKATFPDEMNIIRNPTNKDTFENAANKGIATYNTGANALRGSAIFEAIQATYNDVNGIQKNLQTVVQRLNGMKNLSPEDEDAKSAIIAKEALLSSRAAQLRSMLEHARKIQQGQAAKIKPKQFAEAIENGEIDPAVKAEINAHFRQKIDETEGVSDTSWGDGTNASTHIDAAAKVQFDDVIAVSIQEQLKELDSQREDIEKELQAMRVKETTDKLVEYFAEEEKQERSKLSNEMSPVKFSFSQINNALGIHWMSPLAVYEGWKKYWETRSEARKERVRRDASIFARDLGGAVKQFSPFKRFENEVEQTLKASVDGDNNKAKNAFLDFLKSGPFKFQDLFGPGGEWEKNYHDYNRARAVLEYAAENGWLYHINDKTLNVMGRKIISGQNIPPGDNPDDYIKTLKSAQANGLNKQKSRGSELVDRAGTWEEILDAYNEQLEEHNYMAAVGIFERSFGKGKNPITFSRLTVAFVRHLRNHPESRKYMTDQIMDALQGIGYGHPMYTSAMIDRNISITLNRTDTAASDQDKALAMKHGGIFTGAISEAEKRIKAQYPGISEQQLDESVSKILSGQTLSEHIEEGRKVRWSEAVSIFDNEFNDYRSKYTENVRPAQVSSEKLADYYSDSELILMDEDIFNKIFSIRSTDDFDDKPLATHLAQDIMQRYDNLLKAHNKNVNAAPVINFRKKFQKLTENYFESTPRARLAKQAYTKAENGESIFYGMYKRGLISTKLLQKLASEEGDQKNNLAVELLKNGEKEDLEVPDENDRS